jgi:hypothetical protein
MHAEQTATRGSRCGRQDVEGDGGGVMWRAMLEVGLRFSLREGSTMESDIWCDVVEMKRVASHPNAPLANNANPPSLCLQFPLHNTENRPTVCFLS